MNVGCFVEGWYKKKVNVPSIESTVINVQHKMEYILLFSFLDNKWLALIEYIAMVKH